LDKKSLIVALLLWVLTLGSTGSGCEEKDPGHYINKEKKFEITFPEKWKIEEDKFNIDVIGLSPPTGTNDGFRENVYVYAKEIPEGKTADEVLDANISSMINAITDFEPGKRDHYKIGEQEAARLEYKYRQGRFKLSGTVYAVSANGRAYLIYTAAERKSAPLFEKAFTKTVDSFRVLQ